jgi:hypothetical protein
MTKWLVHGLALLCTVLALVVPWTYYGDTGFGLFRIPGWPIYVTTAALLHACTWWNSTTGRAIAAASGVVALITAVMLLLRYDDAAVFFDGPVVPAVAAVVGLGGVLAVAGALMNLALVGTWLVAKPAARTHSR